MDRDVLDLERAQHAEVYARHVAAVMEFTLVPPEGAQIVVAQVDLVVVAGNVQDGAVQLGLDRDELPVLLEIRVARFVLDCIAQVDDELGPDFVVHPFYEGFTQLSGLRGELAQLALKVGSWAEMLVGNQGEAHAGQGSAVLSSSGERSSVRAQDFYFSPRSFIT